MSTISTGTTLTTAFVVEGDTTGSFVVKTGAGAGTTALTIDAAQNVAFANPVTFSGPVVAPAGTAAAPAITTSGDTNTGIFFPAADTSAFAEGGTEAMRLDSAGNVGIGTNAPDAKLDVRGELKVGYGSEAGRITAQGWDPKVILNQTGGEGAITTELRGGGLLYVFNGNLTLRTLSGYNQTFLIGTTEYMRLTSTGALAFNGSSNYGSAGQVLTSNGNAPPTWQLPAGLPTMNIVSGTTQAATANNHYVLTNASATTVTLPASPAAGDVVWVTVANGRVDNVIARNTRNINSLAENMTINNAYAGIQLRYADATRGWIFT